MLRLVRLAAISGLLTATSFAQNAANTGDELRELRKALEEQSKRIDALTEQVARLAAAIQGKPASTAEAAPGKEEFNAPAAAKAEPGQPHHIVVKGETLTSIAKHYSLPLAELMRANKGLDERKLQIGQTVLLPTPQPPASTPKPNP
ncbi:MAG: LysM peptidoglycan-binding domain-containing protein [Chthoniobacteraceae bacterium]